MLVPFGRSLQVLRKNALLNVNGVEKTSSGMKAAFIKHKSINSLGFCSKNKFQTFHTAMLCNMNESSWKFENKESVLCLIRMDSTGLNQVYVCLDRHRRIRPEGGGGGQTNIRAEFGQIG